MIHVHVGSQGVSFDLAVRGIEAVASFALEVNESVGWQQISVIDVGGGLSVNFADDETRPTFSGVSVVRVCCVCFVEN